MFKIVISLIALVAVAGVDFNMHRQSKKDAQVATGAYQNSTTDTIIETNYKIGGWYSRMRAIGHMISAVVITFVGLYFVFNYLSNTQAGGAVIFLLMGGVCFLAGISWAIGAYFYWWRSKPLVQGRFS